MDDSMTNGNVNGRLKGRTTGKLRRPGRVMARKDFSSSFAQKVKLNNETLAKSLAKANAFIEIQAEEIKMQKAAYSELLMQKNSDDIYYRGTFEKLESYIAKTLKDMTCTVDTMFMIKNVMNATKERQSSGRFDPQYQRGPSSLTQTQSVKPMVQGHSIGQVRISLSRINPSRESGARVPSVPVPAVPTGADGPEQQFITNTISPSIKEDVSASTDSDEDEVFVSPTPLETIAMFRNRLKTEDPQEGSSGQRRPHNKKSRPQLFLRPHMAYVEPSPSDDDLDDIELGNRTSYSPAIMDETQPISRLSTVIQDTSLATSVADGSSSSQELTPLVVRGRIQSSPAKSANVTGTDPCLPGAVQESPSETMFHGFGTNGHDGPERSLKALESFNLRDTLDKKPCTSLKDQVMKQAALSEPATKKRKYVNCSQAGNQDEPADLKTPNNIFLETAVAEPETKKRKSLSHSEASRQNGQANSVETKTDLKCWSNSEKPLKTSNYDVTKTSTSEPLKIKAERRSEVVNPGEEVNSAPSQTSRTKVKTSDPSWEPSRKVAGNAVVKKRLRCRPLGRFVYNEDLLQISPEESKHTPKKQNKLHNPRVLVDKLDAATIDAAVSRRSERSMDSKPLNVKAETKTERPSRRIVTPVSYKEPSCIKKLRRE